MTVVGQKGSLEFSALGQLDFKFYYEYPSVERTF
jgi:hypothetical protein